MIFPSFTVKCLVTPDAGPPPTLDSTRLLARAAFDDKALAAAERTDAHLAPLDRYPAVFAWR
jgi:hypothetical protein